MEGSSIYLGGGGCLVRQVPEPNRVRCILSGLAVSDGIYQSLALLAEDQAWIVNEYVFRQGSWTSESGAQIIIEWEDRDVPISDMSGNGEGQFFIAVDDSRFKSFECGAGFLLWYDGTALRRF